jgi:hypothetical protein
MPHSINHGDACFAYFNKIRGIPGLALFLDIHVILCDALPHNLFKPFGWFGTRSHARLSMACISMVNISPA